ncbi:uncharacterized protein SPPG_01680 [Spizellomyces punctatus DAOM BR117]|uniref:DNA 3'-5' helicase n=1 Tax=Spizellomyces punctatus (strain DAOM BR117) TaxID=645134 RepID=A0A0L0HTQ8_SPIPD|nr:uncharacterized protein SPPG_01680 [Spizellomyces punctatus DAOM BR117]KND04249.1 hypothetical protein SPPG_01680 [Spizellomyces punctatus DAOM BR117]|eukprot:XP_016612288.1 hypothetical protein SPPG_01680 [Spizellomyces punctatus DAOM BR117]
MLARSALCVRSTGSRRTGHTCQRFAGILTVVSKEKCFLNNVHLRGRRSAYIVPDPRQEGEPGRRRPENDFYAKSTPEEFVPSGEQLAIFDEVAKGKCEVVLIDAKAGSGKTTTLIESLPHIPNGVPTVAVFAFNRANVNILRERAHAIQRKKGLSRFQTRVQTFHAYGKDMWVKYLGVFPGEVRIAKRKHWEIMQSFMSRDQIMTYGNEVNELVSKAKLHLIAPAHPSIVDEKDILPDTDAEWRKLMEIYGIRPDPKGTVDELVALSRRCLAESIKWAGGHQRRGALPHIRLSAVIDSLRKASANIERMLMEHKDIPQYQIEDLRSNMFALQKKQFVIDFDDMLYLPIIHGARFTQFPYVLIDEAQDMSAARAALVERMREPGGRLILFGDHRQQIYQFSGARSDMFSKLRMEGEANRLARARWRNRGAGISTNSSEETSRPLYATPLNQIKDVTVFPLSVCRRCPTSVIKLAQRIVPEIRPYQHAPVGRVSELGKKFSISDFQNRSAMVVCRTVTPLINFAYWLMANGVRVEVARRHIAQELFDLIELGKVKESPFEFDRLPVRELARRLISMRPKVLLEDLENLAGGRFVIGEMPGFDDRLDSLMTVIKYRMRPDHSVADLKRAITIMDLIPAAMPRDPPVLLSTIHRARGLERDHVFILNEMDHRRKYGLSNMGKHRPPTFQEQQRATVEDNLIYIAYTRAKETLSFIEWEPIGQFEQFEYLAERIRCRMTGRKLEKRTRPYKDIFNSSEEHEKVYENLFGMFDDMRYNQHEYAEQAIRFMVEGMRMGV